MPERTIPDSGIADADAFRTEPVNPEAEARCRARLQQQPDDMDALRGLGRICAQQHRFDEAWALFDHLLRLEPDNIQTRLVAAGLAGAAGDIEVAERTYRSVLARQSGSANACAGLAKVALQRDQPAQAAEYFRRALKNDPDHVGALLGVGLELLERDDFDQALKLFEHARDVAPQNPLPLLRVAEVLIAQGVPEQAARPLTRALEIDPDFAHARLLLAEVNLNRDRAAAAEAGFRQVLGGGTETARAQAGLGGALHHQGRPADALLAYEASLLAQPGQEAVAAACAECKAHLGRTPEAIADLEAFIEQHPMSGAPRALLGEMLDQSGRSEQALGMWRDAAARDPDDAWAHSETALRLEAAGDYAAAAEVAEHCNADSRAQAVLLRARCAARASDFARVERELLALDVKHLPRDMLRERYGLLGLAYDHDARYDAAVLAFREAHRLGAGTLPALVPTSDIRAVINSLLAAAEPDTATTPAPVLLLGLPGSGVERVAALLADQPGVVVREDRFAGQSDLFGTAHVAHLLHAMSDGEVKLLQRRYNRVAARVMHEQPEQPGCVVDWVPTFDARVLAQAQRVLPGVRAVVVECHAEQAFLDWLAFGWHRNYRVSDPAEAAHWWRVAQEQLELASEILPSIRVDATALLANPQVHGENLAAFLGLGRIDPGPRLAQRASASRGLPAAFAAGHAERYQSALASAFAQLH